MNLRNLYNTIFDQLWEDASQGMNDMETLYLYEAVHDDIEAQTIAMITGKVI